ncbi:epoxide hydrolase [Mycetocola lacteus]|uniref:Epoxide hydrolase n=1 Tax=Mycetocola lacteus TaxID=76637 RepID=A0A3L7AR58_9MICO|nr:epoxide hydrolase family protein [Mycetocola lacteus]RLP82979.1 epoxide hydrolase [Mycetocola lacteus]
MNTSAPTPTTSAALDDLTARIRGTRLIANPWAGDSARGIPGERFARLLRTWSEDFDWRAHERRIRAYPWEIVGVGERALRVIHRRSTTPDAPTVVLLHGWPDSVLRFERVLPLLEDVNVVIPALPGFPFAPPLEGAPVSTADIAGMVAEAMTALGYARFVISAGDVGGTVAELLAAAHPERVSALHLTNLAAARAGMIDPTTATPEELAFAAVAGGWRQAHGGFVAEQATRPGTVTTILGDSPAALLAWMGEKLIDWAGSAGSFTYDDLLTWVSAVWHTGTAGTALSTYTVPVVLPARIETPTVYSAFAGDFMHAPRAFVERFVNLTALIEHPAGGHFAAWEAPAAYVEDLRRALALG